MADLKMVLENTNEIKGKIDSILKFSAYDANGNLSGLEMDYRDGEQIFLLEEQQAVMEKLDEVRGRLVYLALPVREVGRLHKNESGRYETDSGHCYICGSPIEALVEDGYRDVPYWVWTRLEHNEKGYYLAGHSNVELDGLIVRVRGEG